MKLMKSYAVFYALGRDDKPLKHDIDTEALAERVIAGDGSPYELALEAATTEAKPLQNDRKRRGWFEENETEIAAAGGDKEEAYRHYCQGRIDETAAGLEDEIKDILIEDLLEGDEDDDEDGEGEDDNEEEE